MIYKGVRGQVSYGQPIGILLLDYFAPFIPGDVGNASTYSFPVRYELVEGLTFERLLKQDRTALEPLIEAGKNLVKKHGVRAITADCGFFALFQKEMANELGVPVFMSSLLQVPFISSMIGKDNKVGILTSNAAGLDDTVYNAVGIDKSTIHVKGLETYENFRGFGVDETGILDREKIESEVVSAALDLVKEEPRVKSILLECSMMPPYGAAVQRAVNLPVFDFITMINYVHSSVVKKEFQGIM